MLLLFTENFPPKITGSFRVVVNANTKRKVNYTVTDEKDGKENVTLSLNNEVWTSKLAIFLLHREKDVF